MRKPQTENLSAPPRIGVTWMTPGHEKDERYLYAVRAAGGKPVPCPADTPSWARELATIQGLLLTGGGDVDPQLYDEHNVG